MRNALDEGRYGITADSVVLLRRLKEREDRRAKPPPPAYHNEEQGSCYYSGLYLFEHSCQPSPLDWDDTSATCPDSGLEEADDQEYEPMPYRLLREASERHARE